MWNHVESRPGNACRHGQAHIDPVLLRWKGSVEVAAIRRWQFYLLLSKDYEICYSVRWSLVKNRWRLMIYCSTNQHVACHGWHSFSSKVISRVSPWNHHSVTLDKVRVFVFFSRCAVQLCGRWPSLSSRRGTCLDTAARWRHGPPEGGRGGGHTATSSCQQHIAIWPVTVCWGRARRLFSVTMTYVDYFLNESIEKLRLIEAQWIN